MSDALGYKYEWITDTQREAFLSRVEKSDDPDGCWIWTGGVHATTGYGQMGVGTKGCHSKRMVGAHRVSWMLANRGDIPKGAQILHSCDVKLCVSPKHLRVGTRSDNARDAVERFLQPAGETHGMSKLDWESVRQIRALNQGIGYADLAALYGVSAGAISDVCNFRKWTTYCPDEEEAQGW